MILDKMPYRSISWSARVFDLQGKYSPAAMTRYTNFARKRTYLDAELNYRDDGNTTADALHDNAPMAEPAEGDSSGSQPAKKRKRNRPEKRNEAANDTTVLSVQDAVSERSSGPREGEGEGDDGNEAGSSKAASEKRKTAAKGERQRRQKHQKGESAYPCMAP